MMGLLLAIAALPCAVAAAPTELPRSSLSAALAELDRELAAARGEAARVRAELTELAQAAPAGDAAINSATARLAVRVTQLEQDIRSVTGRVEELSFQVRRLEERLDKFIADVDYRLTESGKAAPATSEPRAALPEGVPPVSAGGPRILGQGVPATGVPATGAPSSGGAAVPPSPGTAATPPPPAQSAAVAASPGSARDDYARAFGLMQKGSYAEAETAFAGFLQQHKDDPLAENARYWLGETFYARADYLRATEAFLDAYEKNKTGAKAPDALLKLGLSLSSLGKAKEACASFRELGRAFPDAAAAVKDRARQEQQKLKCP
jgi:tol-pal system protein YbgF